MINSKKYLGIITLLLAVTLSGCSAFKPRVLNQYSQNSFTKTSLANTKFVVGGVTSQLGNENERRIYYDVWSLELWNSLNNCRTIMKLMPPKYLSNALGDQYETFVYTQERNMGLDKEDMDFLNRELHSEPHYIITASFIRDDISFEKEKIKDSTGKVSDIEFHTTRSITAHFEIYDLSSSSLVWSGDIVRTLTSGRTVDKDSKRGGGWFGNILYDAVTGNTEGYPEPPHLGELTKLMYRHLVRVLNAVE